MAAVLMLLGGIGVMTLLLRPLMYALQLLPLAFWVAACMLFGLAWIGFEACARYRHRQSMTWAPEGPQGPLGSGRRFRRRCHPLVAVHGRFLVLSTLDVSNQGAADVVLLVVRDVLGLPAALAAKSLVLFCPHE